jgi:hypothetical protein
MEAEFSHRNYRKSKLIKQNDYLQKRWFQTSVTC